MLRALKIISQLQLDGRTTLEELAKITGFPSMGIKKRLQKLLDQKRHKNSRLDQARALEAACLVKQEIVTCVTMDCKDSIIVEDLFLYHLIINRKTVSKSELLATIGNDR